MLSQRNEHCIMGAWNEISLDGKWWHRMHSREMEPLKQRQRVIDMHWLSIGEAGTKVVNVGGGRYLAV